MGTVKGEVALLQREVYGEAEAARLLRVPQSTLHYWLEGSSRGRKTYLPIIREGATGSRVVTWGEFVEAALLRSYRRELRVPMLQLRLFIQTLRESTGNSYPLAHHRPWVAGRDLLFRAQESADVPPEFWLVSNSQGVLTSSGDAFLHRVRWAHGVASAYRPHNDASSPVIVDPEVRFGRPSIKGISTSAIADEVEAGASAAEVARDFHLDLRDVRWAVAFETTHAA